MRLPGNLKDGLHVRLLISLVVAGGVVLPFLFLGGVQANEVRIECRPSEVSQGHELVCDAELIIPGSQLQNFKFLKVEISGPTALRATFGFDGNVIQKDPAIRSIELIDVGSVGNGYGYGSGSGYDYDGFPYGGYGYGNGYGSGLLRFLYRIIIETGPMDGGHYTANLLLFSRDAGEEPLVSEPEHFTVVPGEPEGPPQQLAFVRQPGNAEAGSPFGNQPAVEIQDSLGNRVVDDNVTQVTLAIPRDTGTAGAVLSGMLTRTAMNGLVTFTGLSIDLAGGGYVLDATAPNLGAALSQPFDVAALLVTASGVALLEGRAPAHNGGMVVALFRDGVLVRSTRTMTSGAFGFDDLQPASYRVEVSQAGWLTAGRNFDINSNTDLGALLLPAGDADGNGQIDRNDLQLFQRGLNQPPWPGVHTDVDDDGTVSLVDMIYSAKNLGLGGSLLPSWPARIAFASDRDGNDEIYVMDADGENQTNITNNSASDHNPAWSPDGQKIAFQSHRDFNDEIYVMDADGSNQTRITHNYHDDVRPAWSHDGSKIAFQSDRDGNFEIYVMDADGSNQARITNNSAADRRPDWSPDGNKITFYSDRDGNTEIYVMEADGSNQARITHNSASDAESNWSPDGTKIAFRSDRDGGYANIYVMDSDGSNQTRITHNSASDYVPDWSPDGTKIAFYSSRDNNQEIYVMDADGTNQTRLTNNNHRDYVPAWSTAGGSPHPPSLDRSPPE